MGKVEKTIIKGLYKFNGDEMECLEDFCLCNVNFYGSKDMLENNLYIMARTITPEDELEDELEDYSTRILEFVHVNDLGIRAYLIYAGDKMAKITEQIVVEKIANLCAGNTLNEIFEVCDSVALGIQILSLKDEIYHPNNMVKRQLFKLLCGVLEEEVAS